MSDIATIIDPVETLRKELGGIEMDVLTSYTLADAIREGCSVTKPVVGQFGSGEMACALSAAAISAKARGYLA